MSLSLNYPTVRPTLLLDFLNTGQLDPRITFSRASSATYFNSNGILTTAATNAARFDYNPSTLAPQGFLCEEQRTNSIRNNTMQGAVAGTPGTAPTNWQQAGLGTLTREIVGTGTENGITYIDIKYSGTTSTTSLALLPEQLTQITAASGQTWASTFFLKLQAGSTANITSLANQIRGYDSGGIIQESNSTAVSLTPSLTRFAYSYTLANAASTRVVNALLFSFSSGVAIDITLRIGLPQLEQGAFATSVIPTTTTALTRNTDVALVNTLSPWFNASAGTIYTEAVTFDNATGGLPSAMAFSDGTANNRSGILRQNATGNARMSIVSGGVVQAAADATAWTLNATNKIALAFSTNDFAIVANGGAATTDTSGTVPTVTQLRLASDWGGSGQFLNGYLRRLSYYPVRLSNAQLQAITSA